MTFTHTPICGTLAYVWDRAADTVLMVHRNARPDDEQLGFYNGLGGKIEAGESVTESLRRELREEAQIELSSICLRGTIAWPGFGPNGEDWLGFVFLVDAWSGTVPAANAEGDLVWLPRPAVIACEIPMFPGDAYFLPLVFDDDPRQFHAVMPYDQGIPTDWRVERI